MQFTFSYIQHSKANLQALVVNEMLCVSICSCSSLTPLPGRETLLPRILLLKTQSTKGVAHYMPEYTALALSVSTETLQEPQLCYRIERGTLEQDEQGLRRARTATFPFITAHQQTHRHLNERGSTGRTEQKTTACRNTSFSFWLNSSIFSETWKWWQLYDPPFPSLLYE